MYFITCAKIYVIRRFCKQHVEFPFLHGFMCETCVALTATCILLRMRFFFHLKFAADCAS